MNTAPQRHDCTSEVEPQTQVTLAMKAMGASVNALEASIERLRGRLRSVLNPSTVDENAPQGDKGPSATPDLLWDRISHHAFRVNRLNREVESILAELEL